MNVYLAIISGAIKLFNTIADGLRQHHDELNGRNQQKVENAAATIETLGRVSAPASDADVERLWDANKARFGSGLGPRTE